MQRVQQASLCADGARLKRDSSLSRKRSNGLEAYVQKDFFDKEALDNSIADFPIEGTRITYEVKEAEDKDWNQEWEEQGFEPICMDDQIVIYDAKHPDLLPVLASDPTLSK